MARIQFETGQIVEFDGDPTPEDIEEVAEKLGIGAEPQTEVPKKGLLSPVDIEDVKGFAKSGISTVKTGLTTPGQIGSVIPQLAKEALPFTSLGRAGGAVVEAGTKLGAKLGERIPERFVTPTEEQKRGFIAGEVAQALPIGGFGIAKGATRITGKVFEKIAEKEGKNIDNIIGQVLQGKKVDVKKAKKVLSGVDVSGVKTYEDFRNSLNTKIKVTTSKLDKELEKDTNRYTLDKLSAPTKVGKKDVRQNFISDGLDQLELFYRNTNNPVNAEKINQLREKAIYEGLTIKEINILSRTHNQELSNKAFSKLGEPLKGINAQSAENTRKGIKQIARKFYGNEIFELMDSEISNLIRTRDLSESMIENVQKLQQKIQDRSLGGKAGYVVGKVINTLGLGTPKGIVEALIPRGQGFKVLNALDLERNLKKNLSIIQRVLK